MEENAQPDALEGDQITKELGIANLSLEETTPLPKEEEPVAEDDSQAVQLEPIDSEWHIGKVVDWKHTYGFVEETENAVRYFIHNSDVMTSDRHVFLRRGMQIRFKAAIRRKTGEKRAIFVQAVDGELLSYFKKQGDSDPWSREIVESPTLFFGVVSRFFFKRGFGWIRPDKKFRAHDFGEALAPERKRECANILRLYVAREDIESVDFPPALRQGQRVSFKLYLDRRGLGACCVVNENGDPFQGTYDKQLNGKRRYTGRVKKLKVHGFLFIKPEPPIVGVRGLRPNEDIHAHCESLHTEARPARVPTGTRVTFSLKEDENGFHAFDIKDENEDILPEPVDGWSGKRKIATIEDTYEGTVDWFRWEIGTGWIRPSVPLPASIAHRLKGNNGLLFFSREDLLSLDKVFGVNAGVKVRFQLHVSPVTDDVSLSQPRVVATNICHLEGRPFEGQMRPAPVKKDRCRGYVAYYEKRRKICYIKYQGKRFGVPVYECSFEDPTIQEVYKGLEVEFSLAVEGHRKVLKDVVFKRSLPRKRLPVRRPVERNFPEFHQNNYFGSPPPTQPNFRQPPDLYFNHYKTTPNYYHGGSVHGYLNNFPQYRV